MHSLHCAAILCSSIYCPLETLEDIYLYLHIYNLLEHPVHHRGLMSAHCSIHGTGGDLKSALSYSICWLYSIVEACILLFCPFRWAHVPSTGTHKNDLSGNVHGMSRWIKDDFTLLKSLCTPSFLCYPLFSQLVLINLRHLPHINLFMPC